MDEDYENYTDDDYVDELKQYAQDNKSEQAQDEAERRKQLAEMVGGYMGLWWYLRSFSSSTARNIRTYAAVADREAKIEAWTNGTPEDSKSAKLSAAAEERAKKLAPFRDLPGSKDQKVMLVNEFGACAVCAPYVGKVYTLEEAQELVPFHPNCRCTLVRVESNEANSLLVGATATLMTRKESENPESNPMSEEELKTATEWFTSTGGLIVMDAESIRLLDYFGIEASAHDGYSISLRPNPNRAAVYEELYHAKQYRDGIITGVGESRFKSEILAQHYLLDNAKKLKLSDYEIKATEKALVDWEADLNEFYNKNNISNRWSYGDRTN